MRTSLLILLWLIGMLGVAYAKATDPMLSVPVDGLGVVNLDPSGLTMPVAVVLVVLLGCKKLPGILSAWKPILHIEHIHTIKDGDVERLSRRDIEEILTVYLRRG